MFNPTDYTILSFFLGFVVGFKVYQWRTRVWRKAFLQEAEEFRNMAKELVSEVKKHEERNNGR